MKGVLTVLAFSVIGVVMWLAIGWLLSSLFRKPMPMNDSALIYAAILGAAGGFVIAKGKNSN